MKFRLIYVDTQIYIFHSLQTSVFKMLCFKSILLIQVLAIQELDLKIYRQQRLSEILFGCNESLPNVCFNLTGKAV